MKVTIKYGIDTHVVESMAAPTIGALKKNETAQAVLGYGDNVKALINGVEQPDGLVVPDGVTVVMETACNTKAVS